MALEIGSDVTFTGPALPEGFVRYELEAALKGLFVRGKFSDERWYDYRRNYLSEPLTVNSGSMRVLNVVMQPLAKLLGYDAPLRDNERVQTREGLEDAGYLLQANDGSAELLRVWPLSYGADIDAPVARGYHYRFSPARIAGRVLLVKGERLGLLTNGVEIRLIISDPARSDSFVTFSLSEWRSLRNYRTAPDGFALLLALIRPETAPKLPKILDDARLKQARVTKDLRVQARQAVEAFAQGVLDHGANAARIEELKAQHGNHRLAGMLWHESLVTVYRLLFIFHGEASGAFSFAGTSLWRNTFSPSVALGPLAAEVIGKNVHTGRFLEDGLRGLFALFERGINSTELKIEPLGGHLFGPNATTMLDELRWGERGCAAVLDKLLRAPQGKGKAATLVRLNYRDLDVEELGRVYEALLELEPGIAEEPMVRLRRAKLEVVVKAAQGEKYQPKTAASATALAEEEDLAEDEAEEEEEESDEETGKGKKTAVEWIEEIRPGQFYLRVGLGRKSSGAYYTPESFVRFLVEETLGPQVAKLSPPEDPRPFEILKLNCLDPATGSGHFLVGACRYLGTKLYDACLACAEKGRKAELDGLSAQAKFEQEKATRFQDEAIQWWARVPVEVQPYLPGRIVEGASETGLSAEKAQAICRRLVAINCLYGVDKNPLAVELARLSLWLVSQAEGMPLTFLDHRIIAGDSLTGPMIDDLVRPPVANKLDAPNLFYNRAFRDQFSGSFKQALSAIARLDATLGADVTELAAKVQAKAELDAALASYLQLAKAWTGAVMLGASDGGDDLAYFEAAQFLGEKGHLPHEKEWISPTRATNFARMLSKGEEAAPVCYPLAFPEVFFPDGDLSNSQGFDAVIGNPPWDKIVPMAKEFYASYDLDILAAPTKAESSLIEKKLATDPNIKLEFSAYLTGLEQYKLTMARLYGKIGDSEIIKSGATPDIYQFFAIQNTKLLRPSGRLGLVLPSAFHSNEGATSLRFLYLNRMRLECCYSFENLRRLFEIHPRFKFALIVATKGQSTIQFHCAFYLSDDGWLAVDYPGRHIFTYSKEFVEKTGGENYIFLELKTAKDSEIAQLIYSTNPQKFGELLEVNNLEPGKELDMSEQAHRFLSTRSPSVQSLIAADNGTHSDLVASGYYLLYEGKNMHQFSDYWGEPPRYVISFSNLMDRPNLIEAGRHYRLSWRKITGSYNERTVICTLLMPGGVAGYSLQIEHNPTRRPNSEVLLIVGLLNSFTFDWLIRMKTATNITKFVMAGIPVPEFRQKSFLSHSVLQLVSNHLGFAPLWKEQLGEEWDESKRLVGDTARWKVRSALDAVIAQAYGLSRDQYEHILHSFDRKSGPNPYTGLCLTKWDELHKLGLDTFMKKYDPFHHIPLVETLPAPVLELPDIDLQPPAQSGTKGSRGKKNNAKGAAMQATMSF